MIRRAQINKISTSGSITESETFEVFNGNFAAPNKISSLFEQKSGNERSVAYMLMSKSNKILADLLEESITTTDIRAADLLYYLNPFAPYIGSTKHVNLTSKELVRGTWSALVGLNVYNPNATTVFLRFYDAATTAAVTIGTTATEYLIQIPPLSTVILENTNSIKKNFVNGIVIAPTTGYLDTDTTAPATGLYVSNVSYSVNPLINI